MYKDGSGMRALTTQWYTFDATWSPRKWKIFYITDTSWGDPVCSLWIMNADGSSKKRLTPPQEDVWGVACSPDDKKIAYIVIGKDGSEKIRVADPDGKNAFDVTGFFGQMSYHSLIWTNDSRIIIFDGTQTGLGYAHPDGSGSGTYITASHQCWEPNWSPDGNRLAFGTFNLADSVYYTNIFYYDLIRYGGPYQLTNLSAFCDGADWSPDGSQLIFDSRGPGADPPEHLFLINPDGTGLKQLTYGNSRDWKPRW